MIRCLVTATASSQAFTDAAGRTADEVLITAIGEKRETGVELVDRPEVADLILFAESHQNNDAIQEVLRHSVYAKFREKSVVHCGMDRPEPVIPGLYPSIDRRWTRTLCCEGSPYLASLNPYVGESDIAVDAVDLLASFTGACKGKPIRGALLKTANARGWRDIVVTDSGAEFVRSAQGGDKETHLALKRKFADDLNRSKFVLCPAGAGPSSFRIFEAMKAARVPVVIADAWTPPEGPDWESFLLQVPEREIPRLPEILHREAETWLTKGRLARAAWDRYFDPATFGAYIVKRGSIVLERARAAGARRRVACWMYVNGPRRWRGFHSRVAKKLVRLST